MISAGSTVSFRISLAVMAKAPVAGRVKTRLTPPLSADQAARFQQACLLDALQRHPRDVAQRTLWLDGDDAAITGRAAAQGWTVARQGAGDLGERMRRACEAGLRGADAVLVLGTDSPSAPAVAIDALTAAIPAHDVVLAPAEDGGYWAVAVRPWALRVFDGIPWGSRDVLAASLDRAAREGLRVAVGPVWYDVDTIADLERLALESPASYMPSGADGVGHAARIARELLAEAGRAGVGHSGS